MAAKRNGKTFLLQVAAVCDILEKKQGSGSE